MNEVSDQFKLTLILFAKEDTGEETTELLLFKLFNREKVQEMEMLIMQRSKEKFSKVLPYRLQDLPGLFSFTKLIEPKHRQSSQKLTLERTNGCFDMLDQLDPIYISTVVLVTHWGSNITNWPDDDVHVCLKNPTGRELKKCCRIYESVQHDGLTVLCHNPFLLTRILNMMTFILGVILTLISPSIVGLLSNEENM